MGMVSSRKVADLNDSFIWSDSSSFGFGTFIISTFLSIGSDIRRTRTRRSLCCRRRGGELPTARHDVAGHRSAQLREDRRTLPQPTWVRSPLENGIHGQPF